MKLISLALCATALLSSSAFANPGIPQLSPRATSSIEVGVNLVSIDYSSPAVKGRKIFGDLVPFAKVWRMGANATTRLTVSQNATMGGNALPAGSYSLFAIPNQKSWTIIVNKDANASEQTYDQSKDLFRVDVKPAKAPKRERMSFLFNNTTETSTQLEFQWDAVSVTLPTIEAESHAQTVEGIRKHVDATWRGFATSGRYFLDKGDVASALPLLDASIAIKETWFNTWLKARALSEQGDFKGAYPLAERAFELGNKDGGFFYRDVVQKALTDWKAKL